MPALQYSEYLAFTYLVHLKYFKDHLLIFTTTL